MYIGSSYTNIWFASLDGSMKIESIYVQVEIDGSIDVNKLFNFELSCQGPTINQFINILHNEGGHDFISEKEYFRLARNIAVEIDLLLLSKYERLFSKNK